MGYKPKVRFNGFTNDWEQRKCKDIFDKVGNPVETKEDETYREIGIRSHGKGIFYKDEVTSKDLGNKRVFWIEPDCFILNIVFAWERAVARTTEKELGMIASHRFPMYKPKAGVVDLDYITKFFTTDKGKDILEMASPGGAGRNKTLGQKEFADSKLWLSSYDEQKKIGKLIDELDKAIDLQQRKCDETKELKKYMLQKLFPKNGAKKPEIRFNGFTDDWEQRKFGDIIDKLTGGASIAPDDYVEEGYRTIPKGAVNDTGLADMSDCKCVSEVFYQKNISCKTSAGELVTSLRDLVPTAPNMGRIVRIYGDSEDFLMPQGVYSIVLKKNFDEDFLIAYSNSPDYRRIITTEKNGSTQVHIRNGVFLNIDIPVPSYEEQKKIGATIRNLDNLITLHQRKYEELITLKQFFLRNMF